jgi:hypothetical protein
MLPGGKDEVRTPAPVPALADARALAFAAGYGCAILGTGRVACWGYVLRHELPLARRALAEVPGLRDAVGLAASSDHACAVLRDGTVWCWDEGPPRRVAGIADASPEIAVILEASCVRRRDRSLACWGKSFGEGVASFASSPGARLLGNTGIEICEVASAGVRCWQARGRCAGALTLDDLKRCLALPEDPSGWEPLGGEAAQDYVSSVDTSCELGRDREVRCWGINDVGQLGDGTLVDRALAQRVVGLVDVQPPVVPADPPPAADARATDWTDAPCPHDAELDLVHAGLDRRPFHVVAAFGRHAELLEIDLHDHAVVPRAAGRVPKLAGTQRSVRLTLAIETAQGFEHPTAGTYLVHPGQRGRSAEVVVETAHLYADAAQPGWRLDGTVEITHLDARWVCGRIAASGAIGHVRGRFAAELTGVR